MEGFRFLVSGGDPHKRGGVVERFRICSKREKPGIYFMVRVRKTML